MRIYKKYGDASIEVVRNEPYRLAADVWGIGFKTADTIAQAVGIPHDSPERVKAGLQYTLSQATDNGHCYLPARTADRRRRQDPGRARRAGRHAAWTTWSPRRAWSARLLPGPDGPVTAVYLVPFHRAETVPGRHGCRALLHGPGRPDAALRAPSTGPRPSRWLHARTGADLAPEQEQAVRLALTSKVAVLTGGPGCGKSFTVRSIVELAAAKKRQGHAGRADRAGRETARRADRPSRRDRAPAAEAAARRRRQPTTATTRSTSTCSSSTRRRCST